MSRMLSQTSKNPVTLNDDCWRMLLDSLPIDAIANMDQVCRQWQQAVRRYIQDFRIRIETITNHWDVAEEHSRRNYRILIIKDDPIRFNTVINNWGPYIVELVYDAKFANDMVLWNLGVSCPNLEDVTILDICVSQFLKNNTIETLVIRMCACVYGQFVRTDEENENDGLSNLKTLVLSRCPHLNYRHLISAVNRLSGVTKLELRDLPDRVHQETHLLLDQMPQLEHLTIDCRTPLILNHEVIGAVARLGRLKELSLRNQLIRGLRGCELEAAIRDVVTRDAIILYSMYSSCEELEGIFLDSHQKVQLIPK